VEGVFEEAEIIELFDILEDMRKRVVA
jgi:hypothetical protein